LAIILTAENFFVNYIVDNYADTITDKIASKLSPIALTSGDL